LYQQLRQYLLPNLQRDVSVASGRAHGERVRNKRHVEKLLLAGLQKRLLRQYLHFCDSKSRKSSTLAIAILFTCSAWCVSIFVLLH
jgi:hypothetical protein